MIFINGKDNDFKRLKKMLETNKNNNKLTVSSQS